MDSRSTFAAALCALLALVAASRPAAADVTREQEQELREIGLVIKRGGNFFRAKKYKESGEAIAEAQARLEKLSAGGDEALLERAQSFYQSLKNAHALLELQGVSLPPLNELGAKGDAPPPGTPETPGTPAPADGAVSFKSHVAPILVGKCGRCHVNAERGMFSMSTFANLMRGTPDGKVVFPGDADGSRIIEVIASGDMPRGGGKVAAEELATLKKWIVEGAKFDGGSETAMLTSLAPDVRPQGGGELSVVEATGKETVSWSLDVAPILAANCNGCHFGGQQVRGGLNMGSFTTFLRGGDSGAAIVPGKPAESLLVQKIKGTGEGDRMPAGGRAPLSAEQIAAIEKWIAEGGAYDGGDPQMGIEKVVALARAKSATHEELTAERAEMADGYWRLGMPGIDGNKVETENFLFVGNVKESQLAELAKTAQSVAPQVAELFGAPADRPLIKGRFTVFVFPQRYDYSEFGKMVEKRDIPREVRGHWRYDVVDAYGAFIAPRSGEYSAEALIGQQLAGAYVASRGTIPPRWFSEGSARAAAAKIAPDDARIQEWDDAVGAIIPTLAAPDDFLTGKLAPESGDVLSYSFVKFMMKDMTRFRKLLASLEGGDDFDAAFIAAYGRGPAELAPAWLRAAPSKSRR